MNKGIKMFIVSLLVVSVIGLSETLPRKEGVDPELKPYLKVVKELTNNKLGNSSNVNLGHLKEGVLGNCRSTFLASDIMVSKPHWNDLSYTQKIALLLHECLHCEYGINHTRDIRDSFMCPKDIMHPNLAIQGCADMNLGNYIEQANEYIRLKEAGIL